MTAQLSTVSSWSLGALPLPTVPRPQVFQYRENVDHHDVLCVCVHLCLPGQSWPPPHSSALSSLCSIWPYTSQAFWLCPDLWESWVTNGHT